MTRFTMIYPGLPGTNFTSLANKIYNTVYNNSSFCCLEESWLTKDVVDTWRGWGVQYKDLKRVYTLPFVDWIGLSYTVYNHNGTPVKPAFHSWFDGGLAMQILLMTHALDFFWEMLTCQHRPTGQLDSECKWRVICDTILFGLTDCEGSVTKV